MKPISTTMILVLPLSVISFCRNDDQIACISLPNSNIDFLSVNDTFLSYTDYEYNTVSKKESLISVPAFTTSNTIME